MRKTWLLWLSALMLTGAAQMSFAQDTRPEFARRVLPRQGYLRIESGVSWLGYNTLSLPDNATSSRFSLRPLLGAQAKAFSRVSYDIPLGSGARGLRFVAAFLDDNGTGTLSQSASVEGKTFQPGIRASAFYRFNGYRGTYWWRLTQSQDTLVRLGLTLNVRDTVVFVRQGSSSGRVSNLGLVPLLYFQADHRLSDKLGAAFELDGFAVPGGRLIDANLRLGYALTPRADFLLGVRAFDGLGDQPGTVYNSVRYYYATAGIGFRL